jgi:N-acetylglutamate synthase-like GNAT family acetyltransferase
MPAKLKSYIIRNPKTKKEFENYYMLRWEVLRKPLGKSLDSIKDEHETNSFHVIAIASSGEILGVGRLHNLNDESCQIRYMAIKDKYRNLGIGRGIVINLIEQAQKENKKKIILHSRENSVNFYKKNGFIHISKSHLLFNKIQHYLMQLKLEK